MLIQLHITLIENIIVELLLENSIKDILHLVHELKCKFVHIVMPEHEQSSRVAYKLSHRQFPKGLQANESDHCYYHCPYFPDHK